MPMTNTGRRSGAGQRWAQAANRLYISRESVDQVGGDDHVERLGCFSAFLSVARARCVATFRAAIDIPLAVAASFNDISPFSPLRSQGV
jgi:hypothetical protein